MPISCTKDNNPRPIPPGNNIVYTLEHGSYAGYIEKYGIYTCSDTGGNQAPLIESKTVAFLNPRWGPDEKIYFLSKYRGESRQQVYTINNNGTQVQRVSNDTLAIFADLDVSPLTQKLLYNKNKGGITQLCSNNLQMTDEKVLLTTAASASWSPDGSRVVYSQSGGLYIMNADGTGQTKITSNTLQLSISSTPFISPDGSKIVYTSARDRLVTNTTLTSYLTDVYTCNIDGSNEIRISNAVPQTDFWYNANWAADNERVLIFQYGFRIQHSMRIRNTRDNSEKSVLGFWTTMSADIK
ncbi:MAG TPA: DPP IV N-terminal domain-containing protein [Flavitalea sp.]|nr:DPP IV N-terminal domain-containing protein [Flavitalea sp.]